MVTLVGIKLSKVSYLQLSPFNAEVFSHDSTTTLRRHLHAPQYRRPRAHASRDSVCVDQDRVGCEQDRQPHGGPCFEELNEELAEEGVTIDIDALVGSVSAMWSVLHRDGALLTANDLLRGEKVRPMAQDLVNSWDTVSKNAIEGAQS